MLTKSDYIKLDPPLAWVSEDGQTGLVLGLGKDSLLLRPHSSAWSSSRDQASITVHLTAERSFRFVGRWHRESDPWLVTLTEEHLQPLHELLGQLRKDQHIELCYKQDVEASDRFTGFETFSLRPEALPLVDPADLDTTVSFLGREFAAPLLITGMTGGISKGIEINRRLALAAQTYGIPMGVGSQRIALDKEEYAAIFRVKHYAPKVFLIGNIGMAQLLNENALDQCQRAVDMIEADALAIHFNIVQEFIQVEGDRRFKGLLQQLEHICKKLSVPVIAKEVGCGMDARSAQRLRELGIAAVDIGGSGGTSWALIEGLRSQSPLVQGLGDTFRNWGIPTAYSLHHVHQAMPDFPVISTGGIRDGHMVAKAVALGARFAGIGLPLLRAALDSEEGPMDVLQSFLKGLQLSMLASGCQRLTDLAGRIERGRPLEADFLQALAQNEETRWSSPRHSQSLR